MRAQACQLVNSAWPRPECAPSTSRWSTRLSAGPPRSSSVASVFTKTRKGGSPTGSEIAPEHRPGIFPGVSARMKLHHQAGGESDAFARQPQRRPVSRRPQQQQHRHAGSIRRSPCFPEGEISLTQLGVTSSLGAALNDTCMRIYRMAGSPCGCGALERGRGSRLAQLDASCVHVAPRPW